MNESTQRLWESREADYAREVRRLKALRQCVSHPTLRRSFGVRLYYARRKLEVCRLYLAELAEQREGASQPQHSSVDDYHV